MISAFFQYTNVRFSEIVSKIKISKRKTEPNIENPPLSKGVYLSSAVTNVLALALPVVILQVYDRVLPNSSFGTLNMLLIGLAAVIVVDTALKCLRSYLTNWSAAAFTHNISVQAFKIIMRSPQTNHRRDTAAEHLERLNSIFAFGDYLGSSARLFAVDFLFVPIFLVVIAIVGGPLFVVPVTLFSVFGYIGMRRTKKHQRLYQKSDQIDVRKNDFIIEVLNAMPTIKSLAMEPLIMRRYERLHLESSEIARQTMIVSSDAQSYGAFYASISTVFVVGFGAILVIQGQLTIGGLACCMLLSSQMLQPLMRTLSAWNNFQLSGLNREKMDRTFSTHSFEPGETATDAPTVPYPAHISLRNVTIQRNHSKPLFEHLNLEIPPGALVVVRGGDGTGRSSLLRTISGSLVPTHGEVHIGGHQATVKKRQVIRDGIFYIQQEPTLFRGTLLDNLTIFGRSPVSACLEATTLIGLDKEINRMPLGYDTLIRSSNRVDISYSTAQQICIARALAQRPAVLILDEANTALDLSGDSKLIAALKAIRGEITVVAATHRPSIINLADQAFQIVEGTLFPIKSGCTKPKAASL